MGINFSTFDTGYDGGSSGSDSEGPNETLSEKSPFTLRTPSGPAPLQPSLSVLPGPCLPDFWLIVRVLQDRVEVYAHAQWVEARACLHPGAAINLFSLFSVVKSKTWDWELQQESDLNSKVRASDLFSHLKNHITVDFLNRVEKPMENLDFSWTLRTSMVQSNFRGWYIKIRNNS